MCPGHLDTFLHELERSSSWVDYANRSLYRILYASTVVQKSVIGGGFLSYMPDPMVVGQLADCI